MRVLFLAAEAAPFVKVGGLGDVAGSLPPALRRLGVDVRLALPLHPVMRDRLPALGGGGGVRVSLGDEVYPVQTWEADHQGTPVFLLEAEPLNQPPQVYAPDASLDVRKYAFFSRAALRLAEAQNWPPQVVHAHDWHTALGVYLAGCWRRRRGFWRGVGTVLTVHNLPFMGAAADDWLPPDLCPPPRPLDWLPEWARSLPLPLGLLAADRITTVSPGYAREMLEEDRFAAGLRPFLLRRREDLSGILNGIDTASFDPATDPQLTVRYDAAHLERRAENKVALQAELGLPRQPERPLLGMVSRLDVQKGVDLIFRALRWSGGLDWQAVLLGSGDPALEAQARALAERYPQRVRVVTRYDAALARRIYGGADLLLMPSRYEPCGLSQMIAMRYGCLPLVNAVGGLRDTVRDGETGFVFAGARAANLVRALRRALDLYARQPARWREMQRQAMAQDFSWTRSAQAYADLYRQVSSPKEGAR